MRITVKSWEKMGAPDIKVLFGWRPIFGVVECLTGPNGYATQEDILCQNGLGEWFISEKTMHGDVRVIIERNGVWSLL